MAEEAPGFRQPIKSIAVIKGKPAKFEAIVTGTPEPDVSWYVNGQEVAPTDKTQISREEGGRASLVLTSVTDDGGNIACTARNSAGTASSTAKLVVREPPDFVQRLKSQRVKEGSRVEMVVRFKGTPMPKIRWYRERAELQSTEDFRIVTEGDTSRLVIEEVYEDDSGKFSATATNVVGRVISAAHLMVTDTTPPATPTGRLSTPGKLTPGASPGLAPSPAGAAAPVTPITGAPVPKDATVVKPLAVKPADEAAPVAVKAGEKRPAEAKVGEIPAAKKVASKEEEQKPVPMEVDQAGGQAAGKAGIPRVAGDGQEEVRPAAEGTEKEAKAFPSPLGVKASDVDDTSVTLKWTPVTGATDYRVAVTPPDGKVVDPVGGPSVWERTVEGLRPGQDYVFTVAAIGPEGQSNPSKPVKISTAGASGKAKVISPQAGKKKQAGVKREGSGEDIFTSPSQLRRQGDLVTSPSQLRRQGTDDSGSLTSFHTATGEEVMSISSYATAEAGTQEGSPSVHVPQPKLFMSGLLSGISGAFSSLHAGQAGLALNQQQAQMASEVSTIEEISEGEEDELSGAPEFNRGLESCQVARGESVRFECEISGSPPPTIIWLKDGREIDEDNQHFAKYGDDGSFALVITNVTDADSGAYSCQATSKKGQATSTAELTVKPHSIGGEETRGEKIAPIFAAKLTDVNVKEGADARFDCVVAGTPGIEVTWFKDGVPVRNGGNRMLTFRGDGSCSLDVTSVTCDDAGVYDVQAANIAGTSKCSALLVVQQLEQKNSVHTHKPASQPVSLATIQEEVKVQDLKPPTEISTPYVSDSAVTVSWKPVAGATDYNVIVSPADGVVRGSDDGPTFPERRVEGLRSGTEYTFTVVATRKNGHAVAGVPLTQMTRELPTPGALRSESVTDTGMTLAWLPTPGATDYEVSISPPGGDVQPPSGAATEPQRVISGLEPAKEYEVTVTAKIGDKRSAQCEPFKITTKPLGTPAGFNASKITDNSMFVSWTPVGGATDYEVKLDPPAGEAKLTEKGSTVPERQLTGLSGGIEYRISVGAKNQKGDVVWAEPFSVETKDLPTPSGTDVSGLTDNEMTVTWAPVPGATDYTLKVQPQVGEVEVPPEGPGEARRHLMGLLPGVDYTVVVEAKGDKRKRSAASAPIKVKTKALCSPSDIKTSSVTASTAMLEWEMVPGATDYKLHMEPSDGQVTKPKKGGHLPQREVKNLTPGREYVFKITAVSPAGNSAPSQEIKINTPGIAGPSDLRVPTVTDTEATLSWAPVPGAKDYKLRTQPKHGDVATPTGDATSAQRTISGLHPGTNYSVYVSAVTDEGVGVESQPAQIKTKALPCPCSLNASEATDAEFKVAWLPVEGAENYVVTIDPPGGQVSEVTGNPSTPSRIISGLDAGREYRVSVTATGKKGDSAPCEPFSVKTKVLCAPAGISATAITASSFEVTWTPVRGASEYDVRMNPDSGKVEVPDDGPSAPRRSITGLSAGIEYQITVVAKKESGAAQPSEPFMVKTRTLQSPKALNAPWVTDSDLTLTWEKVRGATDYAVRLQPPTGEVTETEKGPGAPKRRVTGLLPGTEYNISVEAVGSEGHSSPSHIKIATKPLRAPFDLAATSITDGTLLVSWPAVPGATDYRVTMDPPDGEVTVARNTIAESKREIKGLQPGKEYQITVLALSPVGSSAPSESFVVKTRALAAPSSISPATVTDNSAGLKWTAVPGATDYTLTVEPAGGEVWETQAGPGDPERVITGLQSGTEYEITVSATGPDGASAPSERIRIKTEALAAPSEVKQATVANEEIVLKWNPVAGATDYELTVEPPAGDIVALKNDRARPMRRLTGLTPGTEYKIVVVAKDAKGNTRKSDTFTATTLNIPKAEGLRAYDITDTTVYLEWAAISGSKDYTINLRPSAIASVSAPENDMTKPERLVQGLQPSTEYNISVSAITADGRGPPCNPVTIVTKALPMPEDFKLVNVTDETALINWASIEGAKDFHVAVEPEGPKVVPTEAGKSASERALRGLQPARDYWVTVTAKNEKGESNESQTFSFKTMALSTPSGFKTSHVTDTTCVLSWTPVSGSDDYTVKVQPQGGEIAVPSAGPSASERHLKRLKGKTTYTVTIVATSSKGKSAESQSFTFTTTELPSPSGVEVSSVTASGLVMAWSPVPGATDYIITSEPDARVSPGEGGKSDARRVVSGLEPGTEYTFTVVAVSTEGSSAACEPVKVKTRVLDTPAKIEVATATTNTAVITWTAVKGATDYKIVVEPPGAEVLVDKEGPAAPKRILKGLHPDTHYHVYVTAISAAGESTRSEALEIQTAALPSPARLSAPTVTDRNVIVSWAPTEGAEEYIVKVEPECEVVPTAGGPGATERELRNLKPATEYTIRVAAKGPLGTSAYTEPLPIRTNALPAPSKVEVPFVSDKEVRVSWAAVPGATDYHVKTQPEASVQHGEGGPGAPERIVTGLKPNTEYSIRVVALTKKGSSGLTEPVEVTTKALETPSKIMPASTTADTAVITWSAVKGATDYKVVVEPSGPDVVVDKEGPAAPKRILKGLHPDSEYTAYVTAVGAAGDSTRSEPFTLKTPGLPVPARLGTPTVTDRNVIVSWAPIEGAEEYIVKVEPECEVVPTAGGRGAPERELRNLKPATEYIVRVAAKFPQGTSAESEHLSIRTNALPAPAGVEVPFVSDKEVRVSWPAVPGATDYHVKTQPEASVQPGEGGPDAPVRIVTGMNPKTEYSIRVVALTKKGSSALSEPVKVTTKALPRPNESRVKSVTDNSAIIAWTGIQGAADYQISVEPKCEVKQTKKATAPERELRGLLSGTEYTVTITAVGKAGTSAVSEPLIVRTKALLPPTDVQASSVTDSSLLLVWKHVEGATSYIISAEPDKARVQLVDDTKGKAAPERLLTQLWPNTEYAFTIIAVSNEESSMECEPFKVKTLALSKPSRVTAGKVGDTSALLVWAPAEAATNYVLAVNPQAEVIPTDKGPSGAERVLKGLKTNTEYTVSVTAKNPDGTSAPSDEFVFKTRALPSPEKPSQGAVTDTTATVAWAAVPGASDYVVKVDPEGQVMETADGAGAPVRQIQGLKPGTEYKVVVAGKGEKGDGAECEPIVIKTNPLPSPAGIKTTSVVDNKLTLGWTAVPGATDYKVVSSPEDVQVVTRKGGRADSERAITGLRPGTEYSFSVVAVCPDGSSAQTEPVKVTTKALPTPGGVKAGTVGDTTATVVWSNVPGASDYTVQVEPAGEAVLTKEGPAAPVREIRGLQAGQEYRVAVVGKGPSGESAPCEPISIKTNTLATPSGLKPSTVDDTSVTLAWTSVPGATDYVISGVPKGSKVSPGKDGPAGAERVITGLKAGTDYSLSVTAVGSKGESGVGQPVLVTTKALPTPGDVAVSSSDDSATISWAPVPGAKDYEIVTDPPAQVSPTDKGPLAAERVVKGLEPGTDYEVQIAATNDKGESNQCRPVKFSTKACQRPTGVKSPSVTDNQATLTWSPVPGATDYRVLVEPAEGSVKLPTGGPGEAERTLVGLTAGAEYTVSVIGMTEKGSGEASEPLKITTRADEEVVPPAAPAQLKPTEPATKPAEAAAPTEEEKKEGKPEAMTPTVEKEPEDKLPPAASKAEVKSTAEPAAPVPDKKEEVLPKPEAVTVAAEEMVVEVTPDKATVPKPTEVEQKGEEKLPPTAPKAAVKPSAEKPTVGEKLEERPTTLEAVEELMGAVEVPGPGAVPKGKKEQPREGIPEGESAKPEAAVAKPKEAAKALPSPADVRVNHVTESGMSLGWSPVPGAARYEVAVQTEGIELLTGKTTNVEYQIDGLKPSKKYHYSVTAIGADGTRSAPSKTFHQITKALSTPGGIKPSSLTETGATIAWKPVSGATNYTVSVTPAHGRVVESSGGAAGAERRLTDLQPNTEYTVSIAAEGVKGTSATSTPIVLKTKDDEERKRREAEELRQKQHKEEEERKQQVLLKQQKEEDQKQQALLEKQRKEEEQRKQQDLLDKQRREKEENELLEKQRREAEEEKRRQQNLLEKQRQEEEDNKRKELAEKERLAEEERKQQELLEKQRKEEDKKQKELAEKRQAEEQRKEQELLDKQRQDEEKARNEKELLEKQRKLEDEKKQKELQEKQSKEEDQKKQLEKQRKEEEDRKQKSLLEKKRKDEEERKQKELLEKQKKEEGEKKRKELEKKKLEDEKKQKEQEEERKKKEILDKKKKEEELKQKELLEKKKKEEEDQKKKQLLEKKKKDEEAAATAPEEVEEEEEPEEFSTGISAFAEARQAAKEQQSIEVRAAPVVTIDASAYAAMAVAHHPTSVRTSMVQDRTLMLNWDPVVGAEDYDVTFEPCGDAEVFLTDYGPVAPMRKIRGLKPCKTYKITVAAKKANKERTKESEVIKVTTKALPTPSEFRAIRCLDNKVLFGFDAVYGATSYIVGTDSKEGVSRVTRIDYDRVEVEITDLLPAKEYQVTVTAQGPKGVSAPSKYFTIGTKVITEPEDLVAKADSENDMTVTWSHVKGATDYEFLITPEGKVREAGSTTRKVSGLKPGVEYRISVAAKKGELVGSSAITRSFTKALARPDGMRCVSASDTSVIVAWNRVQGATGYDVETRPSGGTAITPKLPGAPEREIAGLRPATEYEIIITGRSSRGDGLASKPLKIKTKAFGAVSSIRVTDCTDTKALIRWSPVNGATSYDVKLDPSEGRIRQTNGSQSPEREVTGLVPNKEYSVTIIPKSASGEGSANKPFSFTTMALSTPTNIKVTEITEEGMSLTWDEVPGAYDYTVWMDPPGATIIAGSGGDRAPERHISRLKSNKEYSISIVAESPRGNSCRSDPVEVTTEALHGPTGLKTTNITQTGMRLTFNPVANARDYEVILRPRLGTVFPPGRGNDPTQSERIIEDLKPNTEYDISVIAITHKGVKSEVSKSIKRRTYGTGRRKRKRRRNSEKDRQRRRERRSAARESKRKGLARRRRATIKKKWRRRKKNAFHKKPWRFGWQ
ncbi:twitchin-like isoform X5 [Branchiostoma lanceolatum]|uniref:twitchin-like isoform X5 n=1 Tax=Branchiostoma lanceolatum TaxID=7740 RepID=UPI0034554E43